MVLREPVSGGSKALCVFVLRVEVKHRLGSLADGVPFQSSYRVLLLIERTVDWSLYTFTGHDAAIVPYEAQRDSAAEGVPLSLLERMEARGLNITEAAFQPEIAEMGRRSQHRNATDGAGSGLFRVRVR